LKPSKAWRSVRRPKAQQTEQELVKNYDEFATENVVAVARHYRDGDGRNHGVEKQRGVNPSDSATLNSKGFFVSKHEQHSG
jgi:hypothetical protein